MSMTVCNDCGGYVDSEAAPDSYVEGHPATPRYDDGAWLCAQCLADWRDLTPAERELAKRTCE